jgi:flagellar FliJ protein
MSGVKSVLLAIHVATLRRDQAAAILTQMQQAQAQAQGQMAQLQGYADETQTRWTAAAQTSMTTELLRHHYQFMDRLHQAIGMQQGVLEQVATKVERARAFWLETEVRLTGLNQVLKQKQAELALAQVRREQKQMDEFAAMQSRRLALQSLEEESR